MDRRAGIAFAISAVVIAVLAALIFLGPPGGFIIDDGKPCVSPAYGRPGGCLMPAPIPDEAD